MKFEIYPADGSLSNVCVRALNAPSYEVHVTPTDDFDFGNALESIYPILHTVFSYLTNVELRTVTLVKPSWKQVANEILSKRVAASWMLLSKQLVNIKTARFLNNFVNVKYSNINLALIVVEDKKQLLKKYVCVHKADEIKRIQFVEYLSDEVLLKDVECCILSTSKLYQFFPKTENEEDIILSTGMFFPVIPKIRTALFCASIKNIETIKRRYIRENEQIKALFLFCLSDPYKINSFLETLLENQEPTEVALGGGIMRGMKLLPNNTSEKYISKRHYMCMAFLENKCDAADFTALSVVVSSDHCFSEKLQSVKEKVNLRSQTVALRICCSGKDNKEFEVADFNKIFPDIPLLSFDCDGEIGWNSGVLCEDRDEMDAKRPKQALPECEHQWTSIIVFLMWGKVI